MKKKTLITLALVFLIACCNNSKERNKSITKFSLKKEVFGFHPYWLNSAYKDYNFKLLTSVSYFSYELDPVTGFYQTIHDWKTTPLISVAKANGCKVYLTVTNFTKGKNRMFLKNVEAQQQSIKTIRELLVERLADGVTIDFENVPKDVRNELVVYVKRMAMVLKEDGMSVVITLPQNYSVSYDLMKMKPYVKFFLVKIKNYYGAGSDVAGPVSPLRSGSLWKEGSLANSVETYLAKGIPKDKLILSLPYYGNKWEWSDSVYASQKPNFIENLTYREIKTTYALGPKYDSVSETAYLDLISKKGKITQIWFDDARTLGKKYDYINQQELAGVGIWALGYDDGYLELWEVLEEKFGKTDTILTSKNLKGQN